MATMKPKMTKIEETVVGAYQKIEDAEAGKEPLPELSVTTYENPPVSAASLI